MSYTWTAFTTLDRNEPYDLFRKHKSLPLLQLHHIFISLCAVIVVAAAVAAVLPVPWLCACLESKESEEYPRIGEKQSRNVRETERLLSVIACNTYLADFVS